MKVTDRYITSQVRGAFAIALENGYDEVMTWSVDQIYNDMTDCGGIEEGLPEDKVKKAIQSVLALNRALINHGNDDATIRNLKVGSP